jgi:hypothetical protein
VKPFARAEACTVNSAARPATASATALSWHIQEDHAGDLDLSDLKVVMSLRYHDEVQPRTPWEVVLCVRAGHR